MFSLTEVSFTVHRGRHSVIIANNVMVLWRGSIYTTRPFSFWWSTSNCERGGECCFLSVSQMLHQALSIILDLCKSWRVKWRREDVWVMIVCCVWRWMTRQEIVLIAPWWPAAVPVLIPASSMLVEGWRTNKVNSDYMFHWCTFIRSCF